MSHVCEVFIAMMEMYERKHAWEVMLFTYVLILDGWLLDIEKLTLGENIGEGEFGGEFSVFISL